MTEQFEPGKMEITRELEAPGRSSAESIDALRSMFSSDDDLRQRIGADIRISWWRFREFVQAQADAADSTSPVTRREEITQIQ